jgi:cell cycle sensor histidine kinase DivJ
LGVAPGALHGRGLLARVHVSDRPAFLKAISDAATGDQPVSVQYRLHVDPERGPEGGGSSRQAGRVIWAETRAHRIEAQNDTGAGDYAVVAVTRDVSEHRRHADELEQARAEAERADESKGRFLATVSHELRTPLNAIIGFSEMLAAEGALAIEPERRREYAEIVHQSGQHLLGIVNTLLDISKIETGNFKLVPEPFDPGGLLHSICDLMQLKAEQSGIVLAREAARDMPEIVADGRACRQILINLVSNAVKFTDRGGRVVASVRREHDRVLFTVEDTGLGIAERDLPRLGDPFFQACPVYSRAHEGTGLGLSVVRGLVGLHKGELIVESALGEGTLVTVSLPIDCRTGRAPPSDPIRVQTVARRPSNVAALRSR